MQLPDSYANLMRFVPEKARPMVEASMQLQSEKANALQQELAQRQAALEEQRAIKQANLQKMFAELPDELKQFPAVQHDLKRQQLLNDMNFEREATVLSGYGEPSEVVQNRLKMLEEKYKQYEEDIKPVEKTEMYKASKENWGKLSESNKRINTLVSTLADTKKMFDAGDDQEALNNLRTNVLKPLNSIDSDDAIQIGEVLLKFSRLLSAPETAQFAGKSAFNPTPYFTKYLAAKTKDEKEGIRKDMYDTVMSLFDADPRGFFNTAVNGANSHIQSYNKRLTEQVINTTSPGVAKRMGAVRMEYISPLESAAEKMPENKLATPNPFGQTISTGAGAAISPTAPAQETNVLNQPIGGSTIFRIKR